MQTFRHDLERIEVLLGEEEAFLMDQDVGVCLDSTTLSRPKNSFLNSSYVWINFATAAKPQFLI